MYKKLLYNFYILANRILVKQIVHFVRILVADNIYICIYTQIAMNWRWTWNILGNMMNVVNFY